jgi:hypothetical protein
MGQLVGATPRHAWDMTVEICLLQMPNLIAGDSSVEFNPSPFFTEQLTAFEVGPLYKLNSVDPELESAWFQLEGAWFQPLSLKCNFLVSNFAFEWVNLCGSTPWCGCSTGLSARRPRWGCTS